MAIAPERNPPINPQYYQPRRYEIENITLGVTTLIETSVDHDYVIGQLVRILIPNVFGSYQISGQIGYVIDIPEANEIVVNINSSNANPYVETPPYAPNPPQVVAIGDINSGPINSDGRINNITYIDGSFINISPI